MHSKCSSRIQCSYNTFPSDVKAIFNLVLFECLIGTESLRGNGGI